MRLPGILVVLCALASACGGGGESGGGTPPPRTNPGTGNPSASQLLFFRTASNPDSVCAIDARNPTLPPKLIAVQSSRALPLVTATVPLGRIDAASGRIRDLGAALLLYGTGNELHAVLDPAAPGDRPVDTILSDSVGGSISQIRVLTDFAQTADSVVLLRLLDGRFRQVPLLGGEAQAYPGEPIAPISDWTTGKVLGSLAFEPATGAVRFVDPASPSVVLQVATTAGWITNTATSVYLNLDDRVHEFDKVAHTLTDLQIDLTRFVSSIGQVRMTARPFDGGIVIVGLTDTSVQALRIDSGGNEIALFSDPVNNGATIAFVDIAGDYAIVRYFKNGGSALISINLVAASAAPIVITPNSNYLAISDDLLFFNDANVTPGTFLARVARADGTPVAEYPAAAFVGTSAGQFGFVNEVLDELFLVRGIGTDGSHAGAELASIDPSNGALARTIGTLPRDALRVEIAGWPGPRKLAPATVISPGPMPTLETDLLLIEHGQSESISRVTTTPGVFELVLPFPL